MEEKFKKRINYNGDLKDISLQICKDYNFGDFISNNLILMGYEDFNFVLETNEGKHFVKIFANFRTLEDCKRYIEVISKAVEAKVSTPKLYKSKQGYLHLVEINKTKLRLCIMEFIDGKTLFELNEKLSNEEIKFLVHQATLINSLNLKPKFVDDEWAITNFLKAFNKKSKSLSNENLRYIKPLVDKFKHLKIEKLPPCFVHGDIISTNVMKDKKGKLWIIDFAVSNYYPRIQELAVLACNILFDECTEEKSKENLDVALKEYKKRIQLTKGELGALPTYIKLAHGMHLLCANFEKVSKSNNSYENEYWFNQGIRGLKQSLSHQ